MGRRWRRRWLEVGIIIAVSAAVAVLVRTALPLGLGG